MFKVSKLARRAKRITDLTLRDQIQIPKKDFGAINCTQNAPLISSRPNFAFKNTYTARDLQLVDNGMVKYKIAYLPSGHVLPPLRPNLSFT